MHSGSSGVTLRENTERPETVAVGSNTLAGLRAGSILDGARKMLGKGEGWKFASIRFIIRLPVPQRRCDDCYHLYK